MRRWTDFEGLFAIVFTLGLVGVSAGIGFYLKTLH